ncbi:TPA: hypothetical protein QIE17_000266 [Morganella morganii subsp. morganii]|nr:hypothetical protein [Morganella morganii subsp. morganii]
MKYKLLILSVVVLSAAGCAVSTPVITDVDCVAWYREATFPNPVHKLHLVKKKNDNKWHQNTIWYKQSGLNGVKFSGGWIPEKVLEGTECRHSE